MRSLRVVAVGAPILAPAMPPPGSTAVADVWNAGVGPGGSNGTATLTASAGGAGTVPGLSQVRTMPGRRISRLLAVAVISTSGAVAGCGGAPAGSLASSSLAPSPTPVTTPGASMPTPTAASGAPTRPPVISCALMLDPASSSPTKAVPAPLPASLPVDLVPAGAAIYALTFPRSWTWAPDAVYATGPAGGTCTGWVSAGGGSLGMQVFDTRGAAAVDFVTGGGIGLAQSLACAYIAPARKGAEREFGSLDPGACTPSPGDRITRIATGIPDTDLAVVVSTAAPAFLNSPMSGTTTSLYSFQRSSGDDRGASWRATCASGLAMPTCYAALAFFAAGTPGVVFPGGTPQVDAAIAAALGVPATPATSASTSTPSALASPASSPAPTATESPVSAATAPPIVLSSATPGPTAVPVTPLLVRLDDTGDVVPQADTLEFREDGLLIHRPTASSMTWRRLDPTEQKTLRRLLASARDLLGRDLRIEPVPLPGANPPGHGVTSYAFFTPTKTNDGLARVSTFSADGLEDEYWTPDERIDRLTALAHDLEALAAVDRTGWSPFPARQVAVFVGVRAPTSHDPATPIPGATWPFSQPPESFGAPAKSAVVTAQWTSTRGAILSAAEVDAAWKALAGDASREPFFGRATVSVDGRIVDVITNDLLPSEETND